ncbi:zinc finger protein 16 isoform X3 [Manduca sexta]|uniref:zinc finger protein 16 isoform X3 n=1 Tax=Manduca sexta TaxID=7130 RepID=UPI0011838273|nr:zinc finger protein 16 isoform X3 [Manduca sexta]
MEFDEIVVKESPGLCRCCLSEGCYKDLGSEYTWMNDNEIYADMLLECFDISITQHNDGPNGPNRLICEVCITRLRDACNFKKQVQESEKKFIDMVARGDFRPKVLMYQAQMKSEENVEEVIVEEIEYLDDETDFGDDEPLKPEDPSVSDITVEPLPVKGKRGRPRKNADIKTEKRIKVAKTEEKAKTSKAVAKDGPAMHSANYHRRKNLQILFNNTSLIPFKWRMKYMCFYCGCDVDSYDDLKTHTKTHGFCSDRDRAIRLVKSPDSEVKIDVSNVSCYLCNKSFPNFEEIVSHLVYKHNLPYNKEVDLTIATYSLINLKCLSCEQTFKYFRQLVSHMNRMHPSNCFACSECGQSFNKKRDLDHHARVQHRKSYTCIKCSETFTTNSELQHHRKNSHVSTCNICYKTFSSDSKRLSHMKRDHKTDGAECGFCHKVMTTNQGFLRHAAQCTARDVLNKCDTIIVDDDRRQSVKEIRNDIACVLNFSTALPFKYFMNKFRCFYCSKDFTKCDELKEHTSVEHPHCDITIKSMKLRNRYEGMQIKVDTSSLSCKVCLESINDLETLFEHLIAEHKTRFDKSVGDYMQEFKLIEENFACPYCGEVYRYFGLLLRHVSGTHTDNKFICTYCGKSFRTNPNLRAHVFSWHNSMARHKCDYCGLVFTTNNNLKVHLGRAHGSKVVQCTECEEKFTTHYWMRRHMLNAHGSGHKCSYCDKSYLKNSAMVNHVRRFHLKEKNVECSVCSERFFDAQRLKIHMVKHVGERNFHCDVCGKKFLWKKNLRGHMSSHNKNGHSQLSTH